MSRSLLLIGGGVVLVAGVVLALLLRGSGEATTAPQPSSSGSATAVAPTPSEPGPALPGRGPSVQAPDGTPTPTEYAVGDIRVRDHRTGNRAPLDIPPNPHPADGRAIPLSLTHEIAQKVKVVMIECMASVPPAARGAKPRLEGQIAIAIKAKKMTITKATMVLRDVTGDAVEPAKQCVESKSIGLENPAGNEADLDDYTINVSFAIP